MVRTFIPGSVAEGCASWSRPAPAKSMEGFMLEMVEVLCVISGRLLQLRNESSMQGGMFKYKAKNLGDL
jgi:hypothetical protein